MFIIEIICNEFSINFRNCMLKNCNPLNQQHHLAGERKHMLKIERALRAKLMAVKGMHRLRKRGVSILKNFHKIKRKKVGKKE